MANSFAIHENQPPVVAPGRRGCSWPFIVLGCLAVLVLSCGGIAIIVLGINRFIETSEPYQHALELAQNNRIVRQTLGEPIEAGSFVGGSLELKNDDGQADFSFTISGPEGRATVKVSAVKSDGVWEYLAVDAILEDAGGERLDLLDDPQAQLD